MSDPDDLEPPWGYAPPLNPNLRLIAHGEGSEYWTRRYRRAAVKAREDSLREHADRASRKARHLGDSAAFSADWPPDARFDALGRQQSRVQRAWRKLWSLTGSFRLRPRHR
jgi:hypothetical protein